MNLLENSQSTICFFSGKAPGHIWPVLGLEIYRRERIELSMSIVQMILMIVINTGFRASKSFWRKAWSQLLFFLTWYKYISVI